MKEIVVLGSITESTRQTFYSQLQHDGVQGDPVPSKAPFYCRGLVPGQKVICH